jgi:hypothetical protein
MKRFKVIEKVVSIMSSSIKHPTVILKMNQLYKFMGRFLELTYLKTIYF